MFLGTYQHSLDPKGRITIPSRLRDGLGERFVAAMGLDKCIFVYPLTEWINVEAKLRSLPSEQGKVRASVRSFFANAFEMELDKQGRILLPVILRDYAGVERDVVVIGMGSRLEIWARDKWEQYMDTAESDFEDIAESLGI